MSDQLALSIIESSDVQQMSAAIQKITQFQGIVQKTLKDGHDYGIIPGTDKPTLFKPGAEKILMLMGLTTEYDLIEKVQDYDRGFFAFTVKCIISKGSIKITEGVGHANTKESRYTNRWVTEKKIPEGIDKSLLQSREKESKYKKGDTYLEYLIENADGCTLANTVLKMAKKRAQVDAVLTVASLSEIFTQDFDDLPLDDNKVKPAQPNKPQSKQQPRYSQPAKQVPPPVRQDLQDMYDFVERNDMKEQVMMLLPSYEVAKSTDLTVEQVQDLMQKLEGYLKTVDDVASQNISGELQTA